MEFPCARPKRRKIDVATTCSFSKCEMFDLGTAQRLVPLKISGRFCRREPTSCEQFQASSSSPGRCRRHGLRFRRMYITLVSGMPGGIRYCITNNGGYRSNLKLLAIADFSFPNRRENDVCVISFHPVYGTGYGKYFLFVQGSVDSYKELIEGRHQGCAPLLCRESNLTRF